MVIIVAIMRKLAKPAYYIVKPGSLTMRKDTD
ncbi:invertase related gene 7, phage associated protein [Neisseria gonorrhoeae]|uniref:Invertase related gene 7, phage associated protein n=1 Tax=Neisseria gonorrhoeae TaxID=485 RepID=A0A378VW79_NEIGO|nr:invertase related gene 7, phage associated protein [Neisseria gonorrhoeae]